MNKERYLNDQDRKDFLELITPFMDRIRLASEGKGRLTNKGKIYEYKAIFDMYVKDPKSEDLNIGCNNCMGLSYKQTIGKYERELKANGELPVFNMELIEDTDVNVYLVDEEVGKFMTFPKQEPKEELEQTFDELLDGWGNNPKNPDNMKWGAFKKYCTSKGISVKGKTRKELEQELKEL